MKSLKILFTVFFVSFLLSISPALSGTVTQIENPKTLSSSSIQKKQAGTPSVPAIKGPAKNQKRSRAIKVKSPAEGSRHRVSRPLKITWDKNTVSSRGRVNIFLVAKRNRAIKVSIKANVRNTGVFASWLPPSRYASKAAAWMIQIETTDKKQHGYSGTFSFIQPSAVKKPTVKKPVTGIATIQPSSAKTPVIQKQPSKTKTLQPRATKIADVQPVSVLDPAKLVINFIKVLQPVNNAWLEEGSQATITFESNLKESFRIELVEFESKGIIMECQVASINPQSNGNLFSAAWTLPDWSYIPLREYVIRVSSGAIEGFSGTFRIKNLSKTTVYQIPVTVTTNKLRAKAYNADIRGETPDPGPGRIRVGYSHFKKDEHRRNFIYRSWAFFDLGSLIGKGIVTKAVLKFSHYAGCNTFTPFVNILNSRWNGNAGDLFLNSSEISTSINPSSISTTRITDWIVKPDTNYGFVFKGPNEALGADDNNVCVAMYDNVILEVEITGI